MTTAEVARVATSYRIMAASIDEGRIPLDIAIVFSRKTVHDWARICRTAALIEEIDPDPLPVPCNVCGGLQACDWTAHAMRTTYTARTDRP